MHANPGHGESRRAWRAFTIMLGSVVVASVLLYLDGRQGAQGGGHDTGFVADSVAARDAVAAFAAFTSERHAPAEGVADETSTAEGLRRLAAALYGISQRAANAGANRYAPVAAGLLEAAAAIEEDISAETKAEIVRAAFDNASVVMQDIQRARYPELQGAVAELREAAAAVGADRPLSTQRESVQRFFDRASDALRGMLEVGL